MSDAHRKAIEHIWETTEHHKGKALARWAKRGDGWKGRVQRWESIELFAHQHEISRQEAHDLRSAHKFWLVYRWVRAKARRIKRRHKPKPKPIDGNCGVSTSSWAGSQASGECCAVHTASDFGLAITSRKRSATDPLSIANPGSDHNEANTTAYAWDIGTFSGEAVGRAIANCLGIHNWSPGNYNNYFISRPWGQFRVQILWAVAGHFNHVHVGLRRV